MDLRPLDAAAVIIAVLHFSEGRALVRITEKAQPWWLAAAIVLQIGTYLAQGESWRVVTRAAKVSVPLSVAFKLSLAKLFIDQALPSAGISGTVVVARVLEQRGVSRAVVMAVVVVDTVSYYAAYAVLIMTALELSGRRSVAPTVLRRIPFLKRSLAFIGQADTKLARSLPLIVKSGMFQLAIVLLDAVTVWVLIRSLGETASPTGVFASFMVSTLLRTISIVPGGLGAFEAASVLTLKLAGFRSP